MALGDGVSAIASLGSLGVTFGGFSPTLMDGVEGSRNMVERFEAIQAERKEAERRRRELEFARTSPERVLDTGEGDVWRYVVVDDSLVRIIAHEGRRPIVHVPRDIEGKRVYALAPDALSRDDTVREIYCPDGIEAIGSCAFRHNENLRKLVLPHNVSEFSSTWISHCPKLEELVLPGLLEVISLDVFSNYGMRRLTVGRNVYAVEPGAFQNTRLDYISIHGENPFIVTDGNAIYSSDYSTLIALACPVEHYKVNPACKTLAKKGVYRIEALKHIELPEGLESIEQFGLAHSGLVEVDVPGSVKEIGEKAFYHCKDLARITLHDGLESIGDSAFAETSLSELRIPASIERISGFITAHTNIVHSGPDCSISIDERCDRLFLDGEGGLYRRGDDGARLVQLLDPDMETYSVFDGAVAIDDYAFAYHNAIRSVTVPETVTDIGKSAFRICRNLRHVDLPDTVRSIGADAFLDTELEEFRVPAQLQELGHNALVTYGAHHGDQMPSLANVQVAPGNERFYTLCGMLLRRDKAGSSVLMFTSSESHVVLPDDVIRIEEYAFNNARGIDYLSLNPRLKTIGTNGLTTWCWIRHIHIDLPEPLEGRTAYDFFFPDTPRSLHGICNGIGGASWVNVPGIMAQYDHCIAHARDYNVPRSSDNISAYEQVKLILGRLADPILLLPVNRGVFERLLRNYIGEICVDIARHDDREAMDELVERGFVNGDNLEDIIAQVSRLQDAAMTAYLLEVKRLRFGRAVIDFDL